MKKFFAGLVTLLASASAFAAKPALVINAGEKVELGNTNLTSKAGTGTIHMKGGTLVLNSGAVIENTNQNNTGACAIYTEPGATVTITIMPGATVSGPWGIDLQGAGSTITMTGGTIESTSATRPYGIILEKNDVNLAISGGKITSIVRTSSDISVATTVTGGYFDYPLGTTYYDAEKHMNRVEESMIAYKNHLVYRVNGSVTEGEYVATLDVVSLDKLNASVSADVGQTPQYRKLVRENENSKFENTTDTNVDYSKLNDRDTLTYAVTVATVNDDDGTDAKQSSVTNEYALIKVTSSAEDTIVSVPWDNATVQDIVDPVTLTKADDDAGTEGDFMYVYNTEANRYLSYELKSSGKWVCIESDYPAEANTASVARGSSVRIARKDPSKPIYMKGAPTTQAQEVQTTQKKDDEKIMHTDLVGNPSPTEVLDLTADMGTDKPKATSGSVAGDQLVVQNEDGTFATFIWRNNAWNIKGVKEIADGVWANTYTKTNVTIKAGRGFYYRSNGGHPTFSK